MLVVAVILLVLLCLALLRTGAVIEYNCNGLALWVTAGFIKLRIATDERNKPERKRKTRLGDIKPGSFAEFSRMLKLIGKALGRLRRKLLIKKLIIRYTSAGDDPAKTALGFGAANAVFGVIIPVLDRNFRIKHRDFQAFADFNATEPLIYAKLSISIAVWEIFYVAAALLPIFTQIPRNEIKPSRRETSEKESEDNGERTDKQPA